MADITLFTDGTIDFTAGSKVIQGHDLLFTALMEGDPVAAPDGRFYEIAKIIDGEHAELNTNYAGNTQAGAAGGADWWIFKSSQARDSVRTATKQLTDITSLYRKVVNLTSVDQTVRLSKASAVDRAGMILQKAGVDQFQIGALEDDEFSVRYLLAQTWKKALGVDVASGGVSLYSQILLGGIVSPLTITSTANDYAPSDLQQANVLRLSTSGAQTVTGMAGGVNGRALVIMNVGSGQLDLENEGGSSAAANRFALTANTSIPPKGSILLVYDGVSQRWRPIGGAGSSGSGSGAPGNKGWSPILGYVSDGARVVARIADWVGGEGSKPAVNAYIGASGLVSTIADAVDVAGPAGKQVTFRVNLQTRQIQWTYTDTIAWTDLLSFDAITGPPATLEWDFSVAIADAAPGDGAVRFNSATFSAITTIYIDAKHRQGTSASAFINTFDDSSSLPNRGTIMMIDTLDPTQVATFQVTNAIVDAGGYFKVPVSPIGGVVFGANRRISLIFLRTGDKGIPGVIPRGLYEADRNYLVGDVVDLDGSSYISLRQPNEGNAITPEGNNAFWALFARGVNQAFVDAINLALANATTHASNSAASAQLSSDWAVKITGKIGETDFSAKEWAVGIQADTGGSAKNWAQQVGADVIGAAGSRSAKSWAQENLAGTSFGGSARDWAVFMDGPVSGSLWSAKHYADLGRASELNVAAMEENTEAAAASAASSAVSAGVSAANADASTAITTSKAAEAIDAASTATLKAAESATHASDANVAKSDAQSAAASTQGVLSATETARDVAVAAAAAANTGALWNTRQIYLGRFSDPVTTIRSLGTFSA